MNICIFGDSITWGANDYEKGGWVERLKAYYMQDHEIFNLGITGTTTEQFLKQKNFLVEARARKAQAIIFAFGINDSSYVNTKDNPRVPIEKFRKNISAMIAKAKLVAPKILFIGLTPVDESKTMPTPLEPTIYYENDLIQAYDTMLREVCTLEQIPYVDMTAASLMLYDLEDGLHPGPDGHEKMSEIMKEKLETSGWFTT